MQMVIISPQSSKKWLISARGALNSETVTTQVGIFFHFTMRRPKYWVTPFLDKVISSFIAVIKRVHTLIQ